MQVIGDAELESGQNVRLGVKPGALHLFDATGAALTT